MAPKKKHLKKQQSPPKRLVKRQSSGNTSSRAKNSLGIKHLLSEFVAVEKKLDELQSSIKKNVDEKLNSFDEIINQLRVPTGKTMGSETENPIKQIKAETPLQYNATDYTHGNGDDTENLNDYEINTHISKIYKGLITEEKSYSPHSQLASQGDVKSVINAIRTDLDHWRKTNPLLNEFSPKFMRYGAEKTLSADDILSPKSEVSRDVPERDLSSASDSRLPLVTAFKPSEIKNIGTNMYDFPLDRFLSNKETSDDLKLLSKVRKTQNESIKKKVDELAKETDKIMHKFVPSAHTKSPKSSSTSMNESESNYTEDLVENKFKEVTFKKQVKRSTSLTDPKKEKSLVTYNPQHFEENCCHIDKHASAKRERKISPLIITGCQNKKICTKCHASIDEDKSKLASWPGSMKSCSCENKSNLSTSTLVKKKIARDQISFSDKRANKIEPPKVMDFKETHIIPPNRKKFQDMSVNTDLLIKCNTSLINMTSVKETVETKNIPKLYQIQELPIVNIRPHLTKQIGPVIDIKVPKNVMNKNNMAIVECIHSENKSQRSCEYNSTNKSETRKYSRKSSPTKGLTLTKDLRLQKSLKEMLKRLKGKRPAMNPLQDSINKLIWLLNKIMPFHTASIRFQDENITLVDESIDLFFTNIDIVQEVIENELQNPIERFCRHPEYIIKAINLLCGNISSIFDIKEEQNSSVNSLINHYSDKGVSTSKEKQESHLSSQCNTLESLTNKGKNFPNNLYIPLRKLTPGGLHKQIKDNSLSEIALQKKRLEKIQEINEQLKSELSLISDAQEKHSDEEEDKVLEKLNQTFIIESGNGDNHSAKAEKCSSKSTTDIAKKSDIEYEEDWEQDIATSSSTSEEAEEYKMNNIVVEALVHRSDTLNEGNVPLDSLIGQLNSIELSHISSPDDLQEEKHNKRNGNFKEEIEVNKRNIAVSAASQTERFIDNTTSCSKETQYTKSQDHGMSYPFPAVQDPSSCPILRMMNPVTNTLLEIRFPEQSENFQSNLHFQKSESKEEIIMSYKTHVDKSQVGCDDKVKLSKEVLFEKNGNKEKKNGDEHSESNKMAETHTNDFENITMGFIGFLENKVTEMVSKFKSSETESEKLFTEKIGSKQNIATSHCSLHLSQCLNPCMKSQALLYKSASSLLSDKSMDELKFCKNVGPGNSSPDLTRMDIKLVSPALTLQLKKDTPSQTDFCTKILTKIDACVGTEENFFDVANKGNQIDNKTNFEGSSRRSSENERTVLNDNDLLSVNSNLRLSSPYVNLQNTILQTTTEKNIESEVIENKFQISCDITCSAQERDKNAQNLTIWNCENAEKVSDKTDFVIKKCRSRDDINHGSSSVCSIERGSCPVDDETVIPLSKNYEVLDSQRTSVIINMTESLNISGPPSSRDSKEVIDLFRNDKAHMLANVSLQGDSCAAKSTEYNEFVHSIYICGEADQQVELNSKYDGRRDVTGEIEGEVKACENTNFVENNHESEAELFISEVGEKLSIPGDLSPQQTSVKTTLEPREKSMHEYVEITGDEQVNYTFKENSSLGFAPEENLSPLLDRRLSPTIGEYSNIRSEANAANVSLDSNCSSTLSGNFAVFQYNSEDMSEGEIRFVYTSNSYSSGEIRPIHKVKECDNSSNNFCEIVPPISDGTANPTEENILMNLNESSTIDYSDKEKCENEATDINTSETSSLVSFNSEDVQELLDTDDKSDEATMRNLIENNFLYNSRSSSDSTTVIHSTEEK